MRATRIHPRIAEIPADQWDGLHDGGNPFVAHAFLSGLETHGCLRREWGWTPHHVAVWDGDDLVAAMPGYRKENSHGEFVFDHAWAHAYAQHGLDYFPKWLGAVPYSPVTGPRLLSRSAEGHRHLLDAVQAVCLDGDGSMPDASGRSEAPPAAFSSAHVNFHLADETSAFDSGWLGRIDIQYHWRNDAGWRRFDDFLASLDHKHRKNIRQERAKVASAGVSFRVVEGHAASEEDLAVMHRFYLTTFAEYGNHPALTLAFLKHLAERMPQALVIFLAEKEGAPVAGALCLRGGDTLYGRYWGSSVALAGLHFETCYYQGIDYCLREGLTRFEPGAQGEHKLARGFLPALVRSHHWIEQPDFREALRSWCAQETASVERYAATLAMRSPFKAGAVEGGPGHAPAPDPHPDAPDGPDGSAPSAAAAD